MTLFKPILEAIAGFAIAFCLTFTLSLAWAACGPILQAGGDRWFIKAIFFTGLIALTGIITGLCLFIKKKIGRAE